MITIWLLINREAVDHFWVKVMVGNSEVLIQEAEFRNLNIINNHLTTKDFRDAHIRVIEISMPITVNSTSKAINRPHSEEELMGIPPTR